MSLMSGGRKRAPLVTGEKRPLTALFTDRGVSRHNQLIHLVFIASGIE
jgi:hypothetical protein